MDSLTRSLGEQIMLKIMLNTSKSYYNYIFTIIPSSHGICSPNWQSNMMEHDVKNLVRSSTYRTFWEYHYENRTAPEAEVWAGSSPVAAERPGGRGFLWKPGTQLCRGLSGSPSDCPHRAPVERGGETLFFWATQWMSGYRHSIYRAQTVIILEIRSCMLQTNVSTPVYM